MCKIWTKWLCWDLKVLPPDYVTINQNFSPIAQIYLPNTSILAKNNFWKVSQFFRKTYIVWKIWTKMILLGFESVILSFCDNQSKFSPIPQIYTPNTTILAKKNFWKISQFSRKLTLCAKFGQKWF